MQDPCSGDIEVSQPLLSRSHGQQSNCLKGRSFTHVTAKSNGGVDPGMAGSEGTLS